MGFTEDKAKGIFINGRARVSGFSVTLRGAGKKDAKVSDLLKLKK